jgi:hypothetical protein
MIPIKIDKDNSATSNQFSASIKNASMRKNKLKLNPNFNIQ